MKFNELLKKWNKFVAEEIKNSTDEEEILDEEEKFQKVVKKGYLKDRDEYLETGLQDPGTAFPKKTKKSRALSSPGPFAGA